MVDAAAKERALNRPKQGEKRDLRAELDSLEVQLTELKMQFEQYFSGILPLSPDALHNRVKRQLRELMRAPFKTSAMNYKLRSLENRYHTFNTYWQRVLKQREDGTYSKDVFKASVREKQAVEEARAQTAVGATEKSMQTLFNSYKAALEKHTGQKQNVDFEGFQKSIAQRARDFKQQHGEAKLSFKIVVKNGKVTLQMKARKKEENHAKD